MNPANPVETSALEQWQIENECRVCQARPNDEGEREHGKGCYAKSEDGGGSDWPDGMPARVVPQLWETLCEAENQHARRLAVPGGWLYQVERFLHFDRSIRLQVEWLPPTFVAAPLVVSSSVALPDVEETLHEVTRAQRRGFPPNERKGRDRDPEHWLSKIEDLKPGDACEVKYSEGWVAGVVIENGGPSFWRIHLNDAPAHLVVTPHLARVRLPGQLEAWPPGTPGEESR